jgi:hypothetical protein
MPEVIIELDAEQEKLLQEIAEKEHRSAQDLCQEALTHFLQARGRLNRNPPVNGYQALEKMIGLAKDGPTDASIRHDLRPDDDP